MMVIFKSLAILYGKEKNLQPILHIVQGGYRAVIFDRVQGVKPESTGEGTHFLIPWLQRAVLFDVRTKPRNISTTTGSKGILYSW